MSYIKFLNIMVRKPHVYTASTCQASKRPTFPPSNHPTLTLARSSTDEEDDLIFPFPLYQMLIFWVHFHCIPRVSGSFTFLINSEPQTKVSEDGKKSTQQRQVVYHCNRMVHAVWWKEDCQQCREPTVAI